MSTFTDTFNADFATLGQDATAFNIANTAETAATTNYQTAWSGLVAKANGNPEYLFTLLIYLLMNNGQQEMNMHLAVQGASLKVQGDVTKLTNDLQNLTNHNSTNTTRLTNYATHLDNMIDALNNTPNAHSPPGMSTWAPYVQQALNSDGSQQSTSGYLSSSFLALRQQIYYGNDSVDPQYNPAQVTPAPASGPRTYYFDPNDTSYMNSFGQLQTNLQEPGDIDQASEAYKAMTDQFNMITSTTQSTNAASDALISQEKNLISTITSFGTDMMHSMMDVIKIAINNQASR